MTLVPASFNNPDARAWRPTTTRLSARPFHRSLPAYAPTSLLELRVEAATMGFARVLYKDESARLGLPAFKVLGASWAVARALGLSSGADAVPASAADVRRALGARRPTLVTATDGNHGRAVAHLAKQFGLRSRIYVPLGLVPEALAGIRAEGAELIETTLTYDDVVTCAAASAQVGELVIQDTSWDGYTEVPQWIVDGYKTLFEEVDEALADDLRPRIVVVPVGVGSLMQAAIEHIRGSDRSTSTFVLGVEPETAPCVARSLRAGRLTTVDTSSPTIMAGLNCGTPSLIAWEALSQGLDALVTIDDDASRVAMKDLHAAGVPAGPCGAAPLAGLRAALEQAVIPTDARSTMVVLIGTEGTADNPGTTRL